VSRFYPLFLCEDLKSRFEFRFVVDWHELNATLTTQDCRTEVCARRTLGLWLLEIFCM
jgi:hypothetical protein